MRTRDIIVVTIVLTCLVVSLTVAYLEHVRTLFASTPAVVTANTVSNVSDVSASTVSNVSDVSASTVSNVSVSTAIVSPLLLDHPELVGNMTSLFYTSILPS